MKLLGGLKEKVNITNLTQGLFWCGLALLLNCFALNISSTKNQNKQKSQVMRTHSQDWKLPDSMCTKNLVTFTGNEIGDEMGGKNSKIVLYTVKKKCIHFKPDFTATKMIDLKTCSVMLPNLKKKKF